jgi:phage tail-like protein
MPASEWDGRYVAAVTHVSGLTRPTAVVSYHAGGQPPSNLRIPGQTDYEPVRLGRGITTDSALQDWAASPSTRTSVSHTGSAVAAEWT